MKKIKKIKKIKRKGPKIIAESLRGGASLPARERHWFAAGREEIYTRGIWCCVVQIRGRFPVVGLLTLTGIVPSASQL